MWKIVSEPFKNAQYIFPTKQRDVFHMIGQCKKDPNVKKAVIFGSSVTASCNPWSDVDVYFELNEDTGKLPVCAPAKSAFDKWSNFSVSKELLEEINEKGVTVYER